MSIHKSLVTAGNLRRHRNVLTRAERLDLLKKEERWKEGQSIFNLPKVRNIMAKAKKKKEEAAEGAAAPAAGAAAPAAGAAAPAAGAKGAAAAAPAKGAAPAAAAKGAAPAKKDEKKK